MNNVTKIIMIALLSIFISACSNVIKKNPDNKPVRLIQKNEIVLLSKGKTPDCRYLGEIIGSEGHWYDYLFISNRNLLQGALNDLLNRANALDANVVLVSDNVSFISSVTYYGQAYFCKYDEL